MLSARRIRLLQVCCVFFFYCLLIYELCSGLSHAQIPPQSPLEGKKVLVLHAFESNAPIFELTGRRLRATLDAGAGWASETNSFENALKLVSGAKHVYVVAGALELDRKYEDEARRSFRKWEGQLEFRYLSDIPLQKILDTVSTAPPGTIVLPMGFVADELL